MGMRKGFAGLLVLSTFLLGFVLLMSSGSLRISSKGYSSMVAAEVQSNRLAIARNVIKRSYGMIDPHNTAQWTEAAEAISRDYGVRVSIDFEKFPAEANLTDETNGMSTSFLLP